MRLVGMMMVRNEGWVLGLSLRAALTWCDAVVVLDHASTDDTSKILREVALETDPERVYGVSVPVEKWDEMDYRQTMLETARACGATHCAIIDADEVLTGNLSKQATAIDGPVIREHIERLPPGHILELPGYNLRHGITQYHNNGMWGRRWFSTAFAYDPAYGWRGDYFHQREPSTVSGGKLRSYRPVQQGAGGVLHLWGADERRLIAKHAWYKVIERIRFPEKSPQVIDSMYSWAITGASASDNPGTWTFAYVPHEWLTSIEPWFGYLYLEREPWQEAEVRRLVKLHGAENFARLNLFGVEK